jgi:hypothetical protein
VRLVEDVVEIRQELLEERAASRGCAHGRLMRAGQPLPAESTALVCALLNGPKRFSKITEFFEKSADNSVKSVDNSIKPAEFRVFKIFLFLSRPNFVSVEFSSFYQIFENSTDLPLSKF